MTRILLMAFSTIIGLSSVVNAQNAWVLWERITYPNPIKGEYQKFINTDWKINSAYPSYEKCIEKLKSTINIQKKQYDESKLFLMEDGFMVKGESTSGGGFWVEYSYEGKCLPDTVTPRN